jgi:CDP-6-deoxy-D-xylo-4-hexulose-3-dehydrase
MEKATILDDAREYIRVNHPEKKFIPSETRVAASGAVLDADDIVAVIEASLGMWLTEGKYAKEFSQSLLEYLGDVQRYAILCNSGSSACLLAVAAITQPEFQSRTAKPGSEVITTAVNFPTTVSCLVQNRLVPVFVDINLPTYTPSSSDIEQAINPNTRGIILAHTLGNPFDAETIRDIADENGVWFIEDNCDSLGSEYRGEKTGNFGDISTTSFFPAHMVTTGEGGAVFARSPMIAKVVESLRSWGRDCRCLPGQDNVCGKRFDWQLGNLPHGYDHKYIFSRLGYNLKTTDLQAAIGVSQMKKLPQFVEKRRHNWKRLHEGMQHLEDYFVLPEATPNSNPSWFGFCLTIQKYAPFTRNEVVDFLEGRKISTRLLFGGNLLRQPAFMGIQKKVFGKLHMSDVITNHTFWLGVWPRLTDEMIDYVLTTFDDLVAEKKKRAKG